MWKYFWYEEVPNIVRKEPFGVIINGDLVDGVHHGSTTQFSQNLADQHKLAVKVLKPIYDLAEGRFYVIRGTEAHAGKSSCEEERIASELKAIPNEYGEHARYELWKEIGNGLVHIIHHIGTTGSAAYESTGIHKELVESFAEAGRWNERPPDILVRSHRHRFIRTEIASENGNAIAVVTPGWQAKTAFTWKIAGGRQSPPQFGGIVLRFHPEDKQLFIRHKVWTIGRSKTE